MALIIQIRPADHFQMETVISVNYPLPLDQDLPSLCSTPYPHRTGYPPWSPPIDDVSEDVEALRLRVEYSRASCGALSCSVTWYSAVCFLCSARLQRRERAGVAV